MEDVPNASGKPKQKAPYSDEPVVAGDIHIDVNKCPGMN
jgi:hypothetical protein